MGKKLDKRINKRAKKTAKIASKGTEKSARRVAKRGAKTAKLVAKRAAKTKGISALSKAVNRPSASGLLGKVLGKKSSGVDLKGLRGKGVQRGGTTAKGLAPRGRMTVPNPVGNTIRKPTKKVYVNRVK